MNKDFYNDMHTHTNLSFCSRSDVTIKSYLPYCKQEGIKVLGISNHIYFTDDSPKKVYTTMRKELERLKDNLPCKVIVGAEVETVYNLEPNLTREQSKNFDYVLLASSHVFNTFSRYSGYDLSTPEKARDMYIKNFKRALSFDFEVPVGICHPLYPICCPWEEEIVNGITDEQYAECFALAKKKDVSIEIHACLYRRGTTLNENGYSDAYYHLLEIAKAEGCKFHFGCDAHTPDAFIGKHEILFNVAERLGLTKKDIWEIAK